MLADVSLGSSPVLQAMSASCPHCPPQADQRRSSRQVGEGAITGLVHNVRPTVFWTAYFVLRASSRAFAVAPDEGGFWPVISNPSMTTWTPQFLTLEKVAPRPSSSSSTRKGTTFVNPTSASSPSVNPVTSFPSTSGLPAVVFTWRRTPGAWQTSATGFPAARKDSISLMELGSSARSHIGPWPPG